MIEIPFPHAELCLAAVQNHAYALEYVPEDLKAPELCLIRRALFLEAGGYDPAFGARPLKRALQRYVEDPVSEVIIEGVPAGARLKVKLGKDKNSTTVVVQ